MRGLSGLDFSNSIAKRRLVFNESLEDKMNRYFIYGMFGVMCMCPFLVYFDPHRDRAHTGSEYYILFLASLFSVYVIYRKATEKRLRVIETPFDKETNTAMLTAFLIKEDVVRYRSRNNILIFTENTDDFNSSLKKSHIFLLENNAIYFTIIQDRPRVDMPVLTSLYFLEKDLKKLFRSDVAI